jgi:hypothetical protein
MRKWERKKLRSWEDEKVGNRNLEVGMRKSEIGSGNGKEVGSGKERS